MSGVTRSNESDSEPEISPHSPSPTRRIDEKKPRGHRSQHSDESGSSPPTRKEKFSNRRGHRNSKSSSRSPQRYNRPRYHRRHSKRNNSTSSEGEEIASNVPSSKWARHHDSTTSSSSEEDCELERAYQHSSRQGRRTSDTEDVFGLAKLST